MADMTIEIRGLREIQDAMRELPKRINRNMLDQGLLTGARIVRDEAKARVPLLREPDARRRRGTLQRAIRAGRVRPQGYAAAVWVRVRKLTGKQIARFKAKGKGKGSQNPNDPFYWAFVEFGTSTQPARPFMRPAFEARKVEAVNKSVGYFRQRVQAEIAKLGARSPR